MQTRIYEYIIIKFEYFNNKLINLKKMELDKYISLNNVDVDV